MEQTLVRQEKDRNSGWIKKIWNKYYVYIISSLLIVAVTIAIFAIKGYWPFGKSVFLNGDFALQSWPFLSELKQKVSSGESLLYTWNAGYGTNFFTIFTSIINPFTLLYIVMPSEAILPLSSVVFVILELAMNWSMLYFLSHRPSHSLPQNRLSNMMFSLSYTLCMYAVSNINNWHMMICAVYFPLILLGLERFVMNKDWKLYYIMLTISFVASYYMTGLFCIFIILYYLTLEFGSFRIFAKKSLKIFVISIVSILTASCVLIPSFMQMMQQSYTISSYEGDIWFTTFFDIFKNFFAFNCSIDRGTTADSFGEVNLYYGLFLLMLTSFYFLNPKVKKTTRLKKLVVVVFYLVAFNLNGLNYFMHLFHYPSWFPNRFSIFFTLFCIILAYESWISMDWTNYKYASVARGVIIGIAWFLLTLLCFAFAETVQYQFTYSYSMMLFMIYMIGILLLPYLKRKFANVLSVIASIEICLCFTFTLLFRSAASSTEELQDVATATKTFLDEHSLEEHNGFSRTINSGEIIKMNESLLFNQKGNSIFASSLADVGVFLQCMGIEVGSNYIASYTYNQATLSLMNIQYMYDNDALAGYITPDELFTSTKGMEAHYPLAASEDEYRLHENPTVLALGYMIDEDAVNCFSDDLNAYYEENFICKDNINTWVEGISGISDVMKDGGLKLESIAALNCQAVVVNERFLVTNDINKTEIQGLNLEVENVFSDLSMEEYNPDENSVIRLDYVAEEPGEYFIQILDATTNTGYLEAGEEIHVFYEIERTLFEKQVAGTSEVYIYRLDEEQWQKAYDILSRQQLQVEQYTSATVDGTIQVAEDGVLFTSIPYDENWHMYVDGEEVDILPLWSESFVAAPLEAGQHTIRLEYKQSGLILGFVLTGSSILLIGLYMVLERKGKWKFLLESAEQFDDNLDEFYSDEYMCIKEEQKKERKKQGKTQEKQADTDIPEQQEEERGEETND